MHFDSGVPISGEDFPRVVCVGGLQQNCRPEHQGTVVRQERPADDQLVATRKFGGGRCWFQREPEDEVAVVASSATTEVPHRTTQRVVPASQHYVAVGASPVTGLLEGEGAGGGGIWQIEDVHAASQRTLAGESRAASDHRGGELVHVRPMLLHHLTPQRHRSGAIAVIAEELHESRVAEAPDAHKGLAASGPLAHRQDRPPSPRQSRTFARCSMWAQPLSTLWLEPQARSRYRGGESTEKRNRYGGARPTRTETLHFA